MSFSIGKTMYINRNGFTTLGILVTLIIFFLYMFKYSDNVDKKTQFKPKFKNFINLKDLLSASIDAARRGGQKVYEVRVHASSSLGEKSKGETAEGANDPVTNGDMKSHFEMFHSINKAFPSVNIISEEKSYINDGSDVAPADVDREEVKSLVAEAEPVDVNDITVWIDPLDATQEYTENLQQYVTTMVCVSVKGVPTIGVIHKPFANETTWAWVNRIHGAGVAVKQKKTSASHSKSVKGGGEVKVIVSRSHKGRVVAKAEAAFGGAVVVTAAGGAGYKTLEVLNGHQDVYFHSTLIKKWDICAGNAILKHFNGSMTTIDGNEIDYSSQSDYRNPKGIVASLYNHLFYLNKLSAIKSDAARR